jgi:hypothetical protein
VSALTYITRVFKFCLSVLFVSVCLTVPDDSFQIRSDVFLSGLNFVRGFTVYSVLAFASSPHSFQYCGVVLKLPDTLSKTEGNLRGDLTSMKFQTLFTTSVKATCACTKRGLVITFALQKMEYEAGPSKGFNAWPWGWQWSGAGNNPGRGPLIIPNPGLMAALFTDMLDLQTDMLDRHA